MPILEQLANNRALWIAVLSWFIAQLIKVIIELVRTKRFDYTKFTSLGGMPSSHTSFVTAMAVTVGKMEGFDSQLFAMCAVLSLVVMTDAAGVRRAAGKQAAVINILVEELFDALSKSGGKPSEKLKELLGHTPLEVFAGAILGILVGILM